MTSDVSTDIAPTADPFSPEKRGGEIVFYDLEFTAWEGSLQRDWSEPWEAREVIQIGAVRVRDDAAFTEVGRFLCFVSPIQNPALSDYITALTGIGQEQIDEEGFDFPEAWDVFTDFCDGARAMLCYSGDQDVLAENMTINGMKVAGLSRFGELQAMLGKRCGPEFGTSTSYGIAALAGADAEGRAHDAMDDSLSMIAGLRALRAKGLL